MAEYSVYLVRCRNGSLYTGIAIDVERRFSEHESGLKGARYLRGKGPLQLVFQERIGDRSLALQIEARIKRLARGEKRNIAGLPARIRDMISELSPANKEG